MYEQMIKLNTIEDVYDFTLAVQKIDCDLDLMTDHRRYVVDAKSIMGVFSLDLSNPLILKAYTDDNKIIQEIVHAIGEIGRKRENMAN